MSDRLHFAEGGAHESITAERARQLLEAMLAGFGTLKRVLLIPPDFTRAHAWAGELTVMLYGMLSAGSHVEILPALGTHVPMTAEELAAMFPGIPASAFRVHRWREDLVRLGEVPGELVREVSSGRLDYRIPCEINRLLVEGQWDRIISIGQLVPHEVVGIANQNKNIFVGVGGGETINKTHFLGAVCNMESIMGRARTPVRQVFDYMGSHFTSHLPITYLLTVRAKDGEGRLVTRGLYAGDGGECFRRGAALSREVNLKFLDEPLRKVVVYLDPGEFKSTWLGNKAIYRTRMAIADGGELLVLAPGVETFGEDRGIDALIRKYGYRGTAATLDAVQNNADLKASLSSAAHLIHGSSEGRFRVTYCAGKLSRGEVEGVGFSCGDLAGNLDRYSPARLHDGVNRLADGEEVFYISNPALGLWALRSSFEGETA